MGESTLYSWLNVKEILIWNRRNIWILSDCNRIRTHYHLIRKRTLNHLAKLAKWLSFVASTYLYGAFDCVFLACHNACQSESTLYSCLNVKEVLSQNRRNIWSLND